jgi:hypothetical protein
VATVTAPPARPSDAASGPPPAPAPAPVPAPGSGSAPGRTPRRPALPSRLLGGGFASRVGGAVTAGLALRVAIGLTDGAPSTDETAYLRSGLSLVAGDGFERAGEPELHFPPLVPFLLGQASRVLSDPHVGAVVLTCLAGTLLIVPLALLGRRLAGTAGGVATAWVAALAPGLATMPAARGAGSEAEYALLLVTAVWLVVSSAGRRGAGQLLRVAGAGLLVGFAYLTRPEGLFVAVPLGLAVAVLAARPASRRPVDRVRRAVPVLATFTAPIVVCIVPYAMFLHDHTGSWQLTAKTQDVSIEAWHGVASNDREARDQVLYRLDETGRQFPAERTPLPELARQDPGAYAEILGANARSLARNVGGWWLLPLPVWGLAALGAWRLRRSRPAALMLAAALLPVATAMVFFVQPRYLIVTVAMATVLAGAALPGLSERRRVPAAAVTGVLLLAGSVAAFYGAGGWWHPGDHSDQRAAGEWVAEHTDPGDTIMTRSMVVDHYAERHTVALPYADLDEILRFGRHYGVRYLVLDDSHTGRLRPHLLPLLEGEPPDGLRLVHEAEVEGRTSRVFALDPAPPPSPDRDAAPTLGFVGDG